jgi:ribosome-binding factor A
VNPRSEQVANEVQRELADLIRTEIRDPRVGYITITNVEVSHDLSYATIRVAELTGTDQPSGESIVALSRAAGFLRRALGKRLRLRKTPELRFLEDRSIEEGVRMTQFLDDLKESDAEKKRISDENRAAEGNLESGDEVDAE